MWAVVAAWLAGASAGATTPADVLAETGVRVVVVSTDEALFGDPKRQAEPVRSSEEMSAALDTLRRELLRYPPELRRRLGTVRLAGRITLGGRFAVGTSTCRGAQVAVGTGRATPRSQELVAMALHHELGHLAICDRTRRTGWFALSTSTYRTRNLTMWPTDDPALLQRGFVTPYGGTDPREDFAEYASTLLVHPAALASREAAYPAVAAKAAYVRRVYGALGISLVPAAPELPPPAAEEPEAAAVAPHPAE